MLDICAALTSMSSLVNSEMVPALLPMVTDRLQHRKYVPQFTQLSLLLNHVLLTVVMLVNAV